jgi:hypothetical protein
MTFVGLEPQWYITQQVIFSTRPLDVYAAHAVYGEYKFRRKL